MKRRRTLIKKDHDRVTEIMKEKDKYIWKESEFKPQRERERKK